MKMYQLKYEKCPTCSARPVAFHQPWKHTNGEWSEEIKFDCGCRIRYSPNFRREELSQPCPNHSSEKGKARKRKLACAKLKKYIKRLDVDEDFKERLLAEVM